MYEAWPTRAVSEAIAETSGQEIGTPLTYDKVLEIGGDHNGLLRLAEAAAELHSALSLPLIEALEVISRPVFVAEPEGTPDSAWYVALNERIEIARAALNHQDNRQKEGGE
jgi:hypothetical protein